MTHAMRERDLLQHIYASNAGLPRGVTIPPGDDMGQIRIGRQDVLVTVDQVADGVHVNLAQTPIEKVGRKAITRNLSDVAAMAALPVAAVAAASLPRSFGDDRARLLFDAMRQTAQAYDCPLIGGDIAIWDGPMILTVTVFADSHGLGPILRRGAKVGDDVYVTGSLGGSMQDVDGRVHHLDFEPRITLARALAKHLGSDLHCMIDLSDGLGTDLAHLCQAAELAARVEAGRLPISRAAELAAQADGRPAWQHAVGDGEDYELCFTATHHRALPGDVAGVPITCIGSIVSPSRTGPIVGVALPDGSMASADNLGWEHHD